jgi:hypothetical protein
MIDFASLTQARAVVKSRDKKQEQTAQRIYELAFRLVLEFTQTRQPEILEQVFHKIEEALRAKRNYAEPYALLAFIFHGLNKSQLATQYLKYALTIDRQCPLAKELQDCLSFPNKHFQVSSKEDTLYDELEAEIEHLLQQSMNTPFQAEPAHDLSSFAKFEKDAEGLIKTFQQLSRQLALLDQSLEISKLFRKLKPIEIQVQAVKRWQKVSQHLINLHVRIRAEHQQTSEDLFVINSGGEPYSLLSLEASLETKLDKCDQIADELDELNEQGCNIMPVECAYQALLKAVEEFRDALDEAPEVRNSAI